MSSGKSPPPSAVVPEMNDTASSDVARERQGLRDEHVATIAIEHDRHPNVEIRLDRAHATDDVLELTLQERHLVAHRAGRVDEEANVERATGRPRTRLRGATGRTVVCPTSSPTGSTSSARRARGSASTAASAVSHPRRPRSERRASDPAHRDGHPTRLASARAERAAIGQPRSDIALLLGLRWTRCRERTRTLLCDPNRRAMGAPSAAPVTTAASSLTVEALRTKSTVTEVPRRNTSRHCVESDATRDEYDRVRPRDLWRNHKPIASGVIRHHADAAPTDGNSSTREWCISVVANCATHDGLSECCRRGSCAEERQQAPRRTRVTNIGSPLGVFGETSTVACLAQPMTDASHELRRARIAAGSTSADRNHDQGD